MPDELSKDAIPCQRCGGIRYASCACEEKLMSDDWKKWLTEEERETWLSRSPSLRIEQEQAQNELRLLHSIAALRALVAEKDMALTAARPIVIWASSTVGTAIQKLNNEQGQHERRILTTIDRSLAFTEDDMLAGVRGVDSLGSRSV